MSTHQLSLLQGDALAQHRFILESILHDALQVVRDPVTNTPGELAYVVELQLTVVRQVADELRAIGASDTGVPF